jgi:flagellar secretion chaperone FliS
MWRNAHETYLEERVFSASPEELVDLLYQAAINAVGDARRHLAGRRIPERARSISKACRILMELTASLDHQRGGDLSVRLAQLYEYMHRRLVEANLAQSDESLAEVVSLLTTLMEGWVGARAATQTAPPETPWMPEICPEPELACSSSGWSF